MMMYVSNFPLSEQPSAPLQTHSVLLFNYAYATRSRMFSAARVECINIIRRHKRQSAAPVYFNSNSFRNAQKPYTKWPFCRSVIRFRSRCCAQVFIQHIANTQPQTQQLNAGKLWTGTHREAQAQKHERFAHNTEAKRARTARQLQSDIILPSQIP